MKAFFLILSAAALLACQTVLAEVPAGTAGAQATLVIADATGKALTVRLPVKRLVVLTSDALEVIRSLGASDLVKGVYSGISRDAAFWPEFMGRPRAGTWKEINYEAVVGLAPDAVLSYGARPGREMEEKLAPFGIQVIRLDFFRPGKLRTEVLALGRILNREKEAETLAAWYAGHMAKVKDLARQAPARPRVYLEGNSAYRTAGPGSGGDEMCARAGGKNIAADLSIPYPEVTPEWILTAGPEVIIKVSNSRGSRSGQRLNEVREEMMERPVWNQTPAVRQGRVYVIANEIWTGPRAVIGMHYLARWFFPDRAGSLDPSALHREYLTAFQNLSCQGVYVSPEQKRIDLVHE